ncbi:MAG: HAD hydrolase family protein, partial [Bacteroidota bacterium]|nr:HAD hydrolase family protein [Bacteroidota bacterium]
MIRLFETTALRRKRLPRVRCVFCDLDGTLLTGGNTIPEEVRASIRSLTGAGVKLVLASGRTDGFTRSYSDELGLGTPVISLNGAMVRDANGGVLSISPLPPSIGDVLEEVHRSVLGGGVSWSLFTPEGIFSME